MFESLSHLVLQQYWWIIVSLLGALFVFLTFVQGGQTLIYTIGKTDTERTMLINTLGRKWEFTFTTLVTFGGAFFASFPLFYSTSFGGAYWVWFAILIFFVIQAVSYEYRKKPNNFLGAKTFEWFLILNGLFGTILVGTAVGTFFNGAMFSLNEMNNVIWATPFRGLEAVLTFHNVALGLSVFFLARVLGLLYFMNSVESDEMFARSKKHLLYNTIPFLVFFLFFLIALILKEGFAYNPETGEVFMEKYKYLHNLLAMPLVAVILLVGVVGVLWGIASALLKKSTKGIWFAGAGTVFTVWMLLLLAGFNNTSFYPSIHDLQSSLTIENASSSHYTLTAMSYVSLTVPFVLGYIWYTWKSMNKTKISKEELGKEDHLY
ncbi:MAG: cytochrome C oxidase assembly protein [Bacteroidetes bacterium GWF2_42_66]|nr:MAG: cytochrome C oxidase assembly protein [Bacteroidetes bacterium GWA2_42_15]OFX97060.1 MAG: cytochrome C oxidase assembly protein [Bacteroidetes bacterium GWE2_42_39]OFY46136.1 MAG: cytochrome C oxidase assembly protein [Bacteroidetes bacterium GWF2_42_66]HBL75643.1 cytochrome C oxidase assembly protein [Prolixibacteraceae bacterium]HCU61378.1 cytochrome C oxidase assembly protein [Prolixibacteraceae bacterium]